MGNSTSKIKEANTVLGSFSPAQIERRKGGWYVTWATVQKGTVSKRWSVRSGNDFFPPWSRKYPGGGTSITALSQLIRWLKGMPVLPITSWEYWASEQIKLLPKSSVEFLSVSGYPKSTPCVLCGIDLAGPLDWWSLAGVSGPCCTMRSGCKQRP